MSSQRQGLLRAFAGLLLALALAPSSSALEHGIYSGANCTGSFLPLTLAANCFQVNGTLSVYSDMPSDYDVLYVYQDSGRFTCDAPLCTFSASVTCCNLPASPDNVGGVGFINKAAFASVSILTGTPTGTNGWHTIWSSASNKVGSQTFADNARHSETTSTSTPAHTPSAGAELHLDGGADTTWPDAHFAAGSALEVLVPEAGRRVVVPNAAGRVPTTAEIAAAIVEQVEGSNSTRAAELAEQVYVDFALAPPMSYGRANVSHEHHGDGNKTHEHSGHGNKTHTHHEHWKHCHGNDTLPLHGRGGHNHTHDCLPIPPHMPHGHANHTHANHTHMPPVPVIPSNHSHANACHAHHAHGNHTHQHQPYGNRTQCDCHNHPHHHVHGPGPRHNPPAPQHNSTGPHHNSTTSHPNSTEPHHNSTRPPLHNLTDDSARNYVRDGDRASAVVSIAKRADVAVDDKSSGKHAFTHKLNVRKDPTDKGHHQHPHGHHHHHPPGTGP